MLQREDHGTLQIPGRATQQIPIQVPSVSSVYLAPTRSVDTAHAESVAQADWLALLRASQSQRASRILYALVVKRWLDVIAASVLIVLLLPVLLLAALLTRFSRGPIIFRQTRIGRGGQPFTIYKFRTMIQDRRTQQTSFAGEDRRKTHKTRHDPRVTRVGRLLRRTSIDELPQLFNILRGDMSFVGPRPELPQIVDRYQDWQHQRHLVTPGLSGWWQVSGRSDRPMHENTELDIYYVENQSFMLDFKIVLRTFKALLSRGGAF